MNNAQTLSLTLEVSFDRIEEEEEGIDRWCRCRQEEVGTHYWGHSSDLGSRAGLI
jgi:hypothetical protein